jgi:hypothetical protein
MTRKRIDIVCRWVAAVVLIGGLVLVVVPIVRGSEDVLKSDPFQPRTVTTTVTKMSPKGTEKTVTVRPDDDGFVARSLGDAGVVMVRLALVALAAFLAAAITQRVLLNQYAIEVGGLKLPAIQRAAEKSSRGLTRVSKAIVDLGRQMERNTIDVADVVGRDAERATQMAVLARRLEALEHERDAPPRGA